MLGKQLDVINGLVRGEVRELENRGHGQPHHLEARKKNDPETQHDVDLRDVLKRCIYVIDDGMLRV